MSTTTARKPALAAVDAIKHSNSPDRAKATESLSNAERALDTVLDHLCEQAAIGQARPEHHNRWVSALHTLTERITGEHINLVQYGSPHHCNYHAVSTAVITLEQLDLVTVRRTRGTTSDRGNNVEHIAIKETA
jgi:hypothetical protein